MLNDDQQSGIMCHISGPLSSLSNWQRVSEREKGGKQKCRSEDKTVYTACTCCLKNNRKGFALNDSEQRLNIYGGERLCMPHLWTHCCRVTLYCGPGSCIQYKKSVSFPIIASICEAFPFTNIFTKFSAPFTLLCCCYLLNGRNTILQSIYSK